MTWFIFPLETSSLFLKRPQESEKMYFINLDLISFLKAISGRYVILAASAGNFTKNLGFIHL
jgi:hypothetical protein